MDKEIKFLIKFIPEETYVDSLIDNGELFMRPLGYYAELEKQSNDKTRGDRREELLLDCIRVCANYPIYCMYSVFNDDVIPEGILINKRAIQEFFPDGTGHFAIINYEDFISNLNSEYFDGHAAMADLVNYGSVVWKVQQQLLTTDPQRAAFIKGSNYSYQQEFRLIVSKKLSMIKDEIAIEDYKKIHGVNFPHDFQKYSDYAARVGNLQSYAKKYSIKDLFEYDYEYFILKTS